MATKNEMVHNAIQEMIRAMDFDGYLLTRFDIRVAEKIEEAVLQTAALAYSKGRFSFIINEEFFKGLSDSERVAVLKHEAAHFVNKHFARRNGRDPEGWNIACDAAINQTISGLPDGCVKIPSAWKPNLAAEEYYDSLEKNAKQGGGQGKSKQQGKAGQQGQQGNQGQPQQGKGDGQIDSQWDTVLDTSNSSDNGETMAEEITREVVKERIAAGEGSKLRGLHAGALQGYLDELTAEPITNWKTAIQNFPATLKQMQAHYTLKRPDRRGLSPYGKKKEYEPSIVLCIDSSGSVSNDMLAEFLSQANALLRYTEELRVVIADAAVQDSYQYKQGMVERLKKVSGRGGTDFDPAIKYINKELKDFDGVIYLTDGYCPVPNTKCVLPVLWVVCGNDKFEGTPKVMIPEKNKSRY